VIAVNENFPQFNINPSNSRAKAGHAIKVCGITRPEDACLALQNGATHLGLIFVPTSPRSVDIARALHIINTTQASGWPDFKEWVGVFLDPSLQEVDETLKQVPLHALQLHGVPKASLIEQLKTSTGLPIIQALSPGVLPVPWPALANWVLLDRPKGNAHPNWLLALAQQAKACGVFVNPPQAAKFWVAGGLAPHNVAAVRGAFTGIPGFDGLDVASGVEAQPGQKDPGLLQQFMAELL
jgi:phosphoribosylanthranilate isomerase